MLKAEDFFTPEQIDILGETYNISLASSTKAINLMLDRIVNINTPSVEVLKSDDFHFQNLENALAVEVNYVEGLIGRNLMILKKEDIRRILEIMMMTELDPATFEIDEIGESAVCELMNQMMGSAATAMSNFINMAVNISTPKTIPIINELLFKSAYFEKGEIIVIVRFNMHIENLIDSEFYNIMKLDFAKDVIRFVELANASEK